MWAWFEIASRFAISVCTADTLPRNVTWSVENNVIASMVTGVVSTTAAVARGSAARDDVPAGGVAVVVAASMRTGREAEARGATDDVGVGVGGGIDDARNACGRRSRSGVTTSVRP